MDNYRIVRHINPFYKTFKVQKQSFFGFRYNFNNINPYTTGFYDTEDEAMEAIEKHRSETTITIKNV